MPNTIRRVFKIISIIMTLGIIVSAFAVGGAIYLNNPPVIIPETPREAPRETLRVEDNTLFLEVKNGETAYSVGKRLEKAGVIKNSLFWNMLFRIDNEYIKTGTYKIDIPASQMEIRTILISGEQLLVRVTVPEGVTLKKAAHIMQEAGICEAEEFLKAAFSREILDTFNVPGPSMEGYLYPDTYLFPIAYPPDKVVTAMADNFFKRLKEIEPEIFGLNPISASLLNEKIIIASIVEREYQIEEEAPLMAGVFYNRMKIGMALQSCATVEYIITEIQNKPHPDVLYSRDLEIRDPYNTYLRPGLPPGPISAPGESAIKAAFNPVSSDYLYFRLIDTSSGQHYFSRTLDDHIKAGALYLKRR